MKWNPYIIDTSHTTMSNLFWTKGMPYYNRTTRLYEIEIITGGSGAMTTEQIEYTATRGDIFFRKPRVQTQGISGYYSYVVAFDPVTNDSREKCYRTQIPFWIYDDNTELPDGEYFDSYPAHMHCDDISKLEPLFDNIHSAFGEGREKNQAYMKANLINIMELIDGELSSHNVKMQKRSIRNNYDTILQCQEYIDSHLDSKFTLEELALRCNLSKNFFCKVFKEIVGMTPFEYIMHSRMELAKKLIRTTNINVDQIAEICGFEDRTYFYRVFRKYYHTSPLAMRCK